MIVAKKRSSLILILSSFFLIAAFIELSYGSIYIGLIFLSSFILMLSFTVKTADAVIKRPSYLQILLGIVLILATLTYNLYKNLEFQTLDSMMMLLGFSLILSNTRKFAVIGKFSIYFTSIFLLFYTTLFLIPEKIGFDLPYYYGHYLVTLPVVTVMQNLGYNIYIPEMRLITVYGVEQAVLKIDLACFGWYSLLLILSMVIAYSKVIYRISPRRLVGIILVLSFVSYLANLLRVAVLVHLTYYYGVETMLLIHSHLGWIIFAFLLLPIATCMLIKN